MNKDADIGEDITFTGLDPNTAYTYIATLILMGVNNTDLAEYTITGTVTTSNYYFYYTCTIPSIPSLRFKPHDDQAR